MLTRIGRKLMWALGKLLPVQPRKILVVNYYGRGYGDHAKYIADELLRRRADVKIFWAVKNKKEAEGLPAGVRPCRYDSVAFVYHQVTAGIWVDNCRRFFAYKKKNQFYLQLWHGIPLKKIERDAADKLEPEYVQAAQKDSSAIDLLVSDGDYTTRIYRSCFWYDGEIAAWGSPRNDVILNGNAELYGAVRRFFGLAPEKKLVLYAPTFRADHSMTAYSLDAAALAAACEERFGGDWAVLIRLHPNVAEQSKELFAYDGEHIVDATMYPDMQELLVAADFVISDYSSLMFDFALSAKPCMQFATDLEEYKGERGFSLPLDGLPFPLAVNNEELVQAVRQFEEQSYCEKLKQFYGELGFVTDGKSTERCADWILAHIK